jgi:AcrR family transcriptional regulator
VQKTVKSQRPYDASGRRARAEANRQRVLEVARRLFLADGYGATTVTAIAADAQVSAESVYKAFGGKSGLVRAIHERSLLGAGPVPAEQRANEAQAAETDARVLVRRLGTFVTEVAPVVAPVMRLIQDAAAGGDAAMGALLAEVEAARYERMLHNARTLAGRGLLAQGLTSERAADVMWMYTAPEIYENMVVERGWTLDEFGEFVARALAVALLD